VDSTYEALHTARAGGLAIVVVEQFVHHALQLADSGLILQRGTVSWSGPAVRAAAEAEQRYLGQQEAAK
jgi:branched-chain amino acid transport system ATP-binding protein